MPRGRSPPWLVVIASSSGGVQALSALVSRLPADLPATVLVASHTPANSKRRLPIVLSAVGPLPASYPDEGQELEAGRILIAPPDRHLIVQGRKVHLTLGKKEHGMRPAADVLFRSAARAFGARSLGIVLSGGGRDGAAGLAEIQTAGGLALIQAPDDAKLATMPLNALAVVKPDACVPAAELGDVAARFVRERSPSARGSARKRAARGRLRPRALSLKGLRAFIAEDDYLIASDIVGMLRELGCVPVGPVASVATGLRLLEREFGCIDCAVLDVDLQGETALPLASVLMGWAVPFVFATGYGENTLPEEWAGAPRLQKPYDTPALGAALRRALRLRWLPPPGAPTSIPDIGYQVEALKDARNLLMRSHVLRATSTGAALTQSYEAIRRTHECIAASAVRKRVARRMLRGGLPSSAGKGGDEDSNDT